MQSNPVAIPARPQIFAHQKQLIDQAVNLAVKKGFGKPVRQASRAQAERLTRQPIVLCFWSEEK